MIDASYSQNTRHFEEFSYDFDVVVVGAGPAGLCAAIQAARLGSKVALVTDRPILGGSASSEVRVGPGGASNPPWNRHAKETGIWEEIDNTLFRKAGDAGKWRWFHYDESYYEMVQEEENISLYLNTSIFDCQKTDNTITQVTGVQLRAEKIIHFGAKMFLDCSGDGVLAYLSGASYRVGREATDEFDETLAEDVPDRNTMGATLLFTSVDCKHEVKFKPPKWAININDMPTIIDPEHNIGRGMGRFPDGHFYGFWWMEYGGDIDSIKDDGAVIENLHALVYGVWDYIKNSGKFQNVANQDINWIGYLPGKRESRRIVGPTICKEQDFFGQKSFDDAIGYTGWAMDIHPPKGYLDPEPGAIHHHIPGITDIPFRALYSKDMTNLLMAGRDISTTHVALGTLRLICTGAVMGQAAGAAAGLCIQKNCTPADISAAHIEELRHTLVRHDQSIIDYRLLEDNDHSRNAKITASSERVMEQTEVSNWHHLAGRRGLIIPFESETLDSIDLFIHAKEDTTLELDVVRSEKIQNYRLEKLEKTVSVQVTAGKNWVTFPIGLSNDATKKLMLLLKGNPKCFIGYDVANVTGVFGLSIEGDRFTGQTHIGADARLIPAFRTVPEQSVYSADHLQDGHIRPLALPHMWCSTPMRKNTPEWLEYEFDGEKEISSIELVFNSDTNTKNIKQDIHSVCELLVSDYKVSYLDGEHWNELVNETENYRRFRKHEFATVKTTRLKVEFFRTRGTACVEVFDLRIYS